MPTKRPETTEYVAERRTVRVAVIAIAIIEAIAMVPLVLHLAGK